MQECCIYTAPISCVWVTRVLVSMPSASQHYSSAEHKNLFQKSVVLISFVRMACRMVVVSIRCVFLHSLWYSSLLIKLKWQIAQSVICSASGRCVFSFYPSLLAYLAWKISSFNLLKFHKWERCLCRSPPPIFHLIASLCIRNRSPVKPTHHNLSYSLSVEIILCQQCTLIAIYTCKYYRYEAMPF